MTLRKAQLLLGLFIAFDCLFVVLHVLHVRQGSELGWLVSPVFRLDVDIGFPEGFQSLKFLLIISLLGILYFKHQRKAAGVWALVFSVLLLIDVISLHGHASLLIMNHLNLNALYSVGGNVLGEVIFWGVTGAVIGVLLVFAYLRAPQEDKRSSRRLALLLVGFAFFGGVVDMLHHVFPSKYLFDNAISGGDPLLLMPALITFFHLPDAPIPIATLYGLHLVPSLSPLVTSLWEAVQGALRLHLLLTLLEEGGEMMMLSLISAYCLVLFYQQRRSGSRYRPVRIVKDDVTAQVSE